MSLTATITNISRGSLHDGPGIRTVVYLKGCGLRCRWCHNPEALSPLPELLYAPVKCIHCGRCIAVCPEHHVIRNNKLYLLRDGCTACMRCAGSCPANALSICGEIKTIDEVFAVIMKDKHYYVSSGGGVTLSGGECLLYPEFSTELLIRCKNNGIGTAVETALFVPWENVSRIAAYVDLFFCDLKISNPDKHRAYTGQDNRLILENLTKLTQMHSNIVIRIPLIPDVNTSAEDLDGFAAVLNSLGAGIQGIELLRYNHLAASKYDQVGKEYISFGDSAQTDTEMKKISDYLQGRLKPSLNLYYS